MGRGACTQSLLVSVLLVYYSLFLSSRDFSGLTPHCHGAKLALVLLTKQFFDLREREFLKIRHKNVEYFHSRVHAHKPFMAIAIPHFFLALFFSFLPAPLLSLPSACHILSGCRKKFVVNYGQSLEMGP